MISNAALLFWWIDKNRIQGVELVNILAPVSIWSTNDIEKNFYTEALN